MRKQTFGCMAVLAIVIMLSALVLPGLAPASYAQNTPCYRAQGGARWVCGSGGTMDFLTGSTISIDTFLNVSPGTAQTLVSDDDIAPTGTFHLITSAGNVGVSGGEIVDGDEGDLLILLNVGSNTITITETTGLVSAGNIALGTLDSATLVFRGTSWYQIGASNN